MVSRNKKQQATEFWRLKQAIDDEVKRLGWTTDQCIAHIQKHYQARSRLTMTDERDDEGQRPPRRVTPMEGADMLVLYLMRRREVLIIELRELDRMLGRVPTIPVRER